VNSGLSLVFNAKIVIKPPNNANGLMARANFLVGSKIIATNKTKHVKGQISNKSPLLITMLCSMEEISFLKY
jgi:hypothetical protein